MSGGKRRKFKGAIAGSLLARVAESVTAAGKDSTGFRDLHRVA